MAERGEAERARRLDGGQGRELAGREHELRLDARDVEAGEVRLDLAALKRRGEVRLERRELAGREHEVRLEPRRGGQGREHELADVEAGEVCLDAGAAS